MQRLFRATSVVALFFTTAIAIAQTPPTPTTGGPATTLTFEDVVAMARSADPTLRSAEAAILQARGQLRTAVAFPATEVEIEHGRAHGDGRSGSQSSFSITQPLDLFNVRGARRRVAEAQIEIEQSSRDLTLLAFRGSLRLAFVELLAAQRALPAAEEDLTVAVELERLVNRRADVGETREVDRLRMQVERLRAEERVEQLRIALRAARRGLSLLVGTDLSEDARVADLAPTASPDFNAGSVAMLARQPRIRIAEAGVRQAEASVHLAEALRWPQPAVGAYTQKDFDSRGSGVRLGVSVPVWDWNRGDVAVARAALDRARADLELTRRGVSRDFIDVFYAREALGRRVQRLQNELLPRARRTFEIAEVAYRQGETSQLDYLDARRTWVALQQEYHEVLREYAAAESRLEQLTGEPIDARP